MFRSCCLAVIAIALSAPFSSARNIVVNGDFEAGKSPWVFFSDNPDSEFDVAGGAARIEVWASTNSQLYQVPLPLKGNTEYELSFFASSSLAASEQPHSVQRSLGPDNNKGLLPEGSMRVAIAQHGSPHANYGLKRQVNLNGTLRQFIYRFTTTMGDKNDARLRFMFHVTGDTQDYVIDNVLLRLASCGNGSLDSGEECDDGNIEPGDGCDESCTSECQVNYSQVDLDAQTITLQGRGICTLGGPAQAEPAVFFGDASGELVELLVLNNGPTFVEADLSSVTPLDQATHKVIVVCPGVGKEIDLSVGTTVYTVSAAVVCTDDLLCSVTATCPAGDVVAGTWSFDGNLGAVVGGVSTGYTADAYTVTLQGSAGFDGATLEAQIRCAP